MSLQSELNRAQVGELADLLRTIAIGDVMSRLAGDLAVEETVTVTSNVGVLSARAIAILGIFQAAGTVTGASTPMGPSGTLATKTCQVSTDRKTLTFLAGDGVTSAKVLYLKAPVRQSDGSTLESLLAGTFEGL